MKIYIKRINNGVCILRNKSLIIVLFVLSIVFISMFFVASPNFITQNGDYKHFEDNDLSFDMLSSWTVYEYDDPIKIPFLSNSPDSLLLNPVNDSQFSAYDGNVEDLTANGTVLNTSTTSATDVIIVKTEISKVDSLPDGVSLETAYKSDSAYAIMESTGEFVLNNDTALTIDGKQARDFLYTAGSVTYKDTWIQSNGHYYRILSQAPNGYYDEAKPQFDHIVETMKIKN